MSNMTFTRVNPIQLGPSPFNSSPQCNTSSLRHHFRRNSQDHKSYCHKQKSFSPGREVPGQRLQSPNFHSEFLPKILSKILPPEARYCDNSSIQDKKIQHMLSLLSTLHFRTFVFMYLCFSHLIHENVLFDILESHAFQNIYITICWLF